jgi:hypothetical protein
MLGPEGVTRGVTRQAKLTLPARLAEFRERYETSVADLPDFHTVYSDGVNALSIEKFPALVVVIPSTTGKIDNRTTDIDAGFEEYSYRYTVRLFAYVMGDSEGATSLAIKRYTLAVREAFLNAKILPVDDDNSAQVDPMTVVESYSELAPKDTKYLAASYVQFEVVTAERLHFEQRFGDTPAVIEVGAGLEQHPHFAE